MAASNRTRPPVILRPATLSDIPKMALLATSAYADGAVDRFLAPRAHLYPDDYARNFRQNSHRRHVDPQNLNIVACLALAPSEPIAYAQFQRLGDDVAAREFRARWGLMQRVWMWVLRYWFWIYDGVQNWLWPDRSGDIVNMQLFNEWYVKDKERYWKAHPERASRWYAQTVVVGPKWQGLGLGTLLMEEMLGRARSEGVICGLSASQAGQRLYKKLGFVDLGDFYRRVPNEGPGDVGGGYMIWYPKAGVKKDL